jgi:hypothetical protein
MSDIRQTVRENYGEIARRSGQGQDEGLVNRSDPKAIGYAGADLSAVPAGANMGLGCGLSDRDSRH